jgi:hypothetical protein
MMVAPDELKLERESAESVRSGRRSEESVWVWVCECVSVSVSVRGAGTHESVCLSDLVPGMTVVGESSITQLM